MNLKTFELQLSQLAEGFSKSKTNIYSDKRKETHFEELFSLFKSIKNSNYSGFSEVDMANHVFLLNYLSNGLEYLDNSTLNIIPFEMVSCLEEALKDWLNTDNFIIVTSLSNKNSDFSLESSDNEESFRNINNYISTFYNQQLTHRLIRIVLPKVLSKDYLSCVVLYHELGHFIDLELNVSEKILLKEYGVTRPETEEQSKFFHHRMEYFADIFAAQYISNSSNLYLNHIAFGAEECRTHPSTADRILLVDQFLKNQKNVIIDEFKDVLSDSNSPSFQIRFNDISDSAEIFSKLVPQSLDDVGQLHFIFKCGWDLWMNSDSNFLNTFTLRQRYHILNNLIEKTISNHFIIKSWQNSLTGS